MRNIKTKFHIKYDNRDDFYGLNFCVFAATATTAPAAADVKAGGDPCGSVHIA